MEWVPLDDARELRERRLVFDTETNGLLDEVTTFWCASFLDIDTKEGWSLTPETIHLLPEICANAKLLVGHNLIGFDVPAIEKVFGVTIDRSKIRDTLVWSRLANSAREIPAGCKSAHGLDSWARRFGLWKKDHSDWTQFSSDMLERNQSDVWINYLTLKKILQELKGFSKESIQNETDLSWILSDMHKEGFYLDQEKAMALYVETKTKADKIQRDIRKVFGPMPRFVREVYPKPTKDGGFSKAQTKCLDTYLSSYTDSEVGGPFSLITFEDFNLDSPKQRVERLTQKGWVPRSFTDKGNPRFDADEMTPEDYEGMPDEVKLLGTYLMLRSRERTASQWLDLVDSNSYVHPIVNSIGAVTMRASHRNPNSANIPAISKDDNGNVLMGVVGSYGFEMRDCWGADPRIKDQVLVGADLTAIQLRAFAHYTEDQDYIDLVTDPSSDMHSIHAEYLGGVKRSAAKRWLYAFLLGAGNKKLGSLLGGTEQDGVTAANLFMEKVRGVGLLKRTLIPRWAKQGYMVALDGRKVPVISQHLALSVALQSFEKCVIAHAIVDTHKKANFPFITRAWVHDEIQCTVQDKHAEELGNLFVDTVKETGYRFNSKAELSAQWVKGLRWSGTH